MDAAKMELKEKMASLNNIGDTMLDKLVILGQAYSAYRDACAACLNAWDAYCADRRVALKVHTASNNIARDEAFSTYLTAGYILQDRADAYRDVEDTWEPCQDRIYATVGHLFPAECSTWRGREGGMDAEVMILIWDWNERHPRSRTGCVRTKTLLRSVMAEMKRLYHSSRAEVTLSVGRVIKGFATGVAIKAGVHA